ncbi:sensor histidine kinase [Cohnella silvisoli]|uniref:Histidine kinase n=1 Tax=Cohnella silvisoli TaxID=2873699 RepID=A0ABV1KU66_9BACL|nr:histidine kinase [Cohnella silvisoli]MCD9022701.1 histidine kinase [Cohnella silvisoli]
MQKFGSYFRSSIFTRLIITFLLVTFPLYVLAVSIYTWAVDTVKSELSNSAKLQVNYYLGNMEKDIDRIRNLQFDFMFDDDLNQIAALPESMDDVEKVKSLRRIQKKLISIRDSNSSIEETGVYIPSIHKSVFSYGVNELISPQLNGLNSDLGSSSAKLIVHPHEINLFTKKVNKTGSPTFVTVVKLSAEKLENQLKSFVDRVDSGLFMTDDSGSMYLNTAAGTGMAQLIKGHESESGRSGRLLDDYDFVVNHTDGNKYIVIGTHSEKLGFSLFKYIPEKVIFETVERYKIWFWFFTFCAFLLIIIYSYMTYRLIKRPLNKLIRSFRRVEEGDLDMKIEHDYKDEFNFLYMRFNFMVSRLKHMMEQVYLQKILNQRSELKLLQSQINPHFLYNSFFILYNMVENEDNENAKIFTRQLGAYLQYVTRNTFDEVSLANEVNHARNYAEIQARRYRKRIKLAFHSLPKEYGDRIVPRLILQPIIENAFEHGLSNKTEDGMVRIDFMSDSRFIVVSVEDNGEELTEEGLSQLKNKLQIHDGESELTGMVNVHRRLQLKYGDESGLVVSRGKMGGLFVEIKLCIAEGPICTDY